MANTTRKKRRRSPFVRTILRLFFILLLLSMLVAYISNQVSISSRRAELQTLSEQIEQQKTQNEEMKRILSGDADGADRMKVVFERLQTLLDKGYIDPAVNAEYPENNYDGAILKFFEGDVPFWVCDTEKVSGMKKRESKSEAFSANPFSYEFVYAPLGDTGVYEFVAPWYGFAVYKNSEAYDYAVEFLRFLSQKSELNTLASVKGVPAVTSTASDERYVHLGSVKQVEKSVVDDGSVYRFIGTFLENEATDLLNGTVDVDEAMNNFLSHSAESAKGMTN